MGPSGWWCAIEPRQKAVIFSAWLLSRTIVDVKIDETSSHGTKLPSLNQRQETAHLFPRAHHSPTVTPRPGTEIETLTSEARAVAALSLKFRSPDYDGRQTGPSCPSPSPTLASTFPKRYLCNTYAWTRSVPCICTLATAHRLHLHRHQLSWHGGAVEGRAAHGFLPVPSPEEREWEAKKGVEMFGDHEMFLFAGVPRQPRKPGEGSKGEREISNPKFPLPSGHQWKFV